MNNKELTIIGLIAIALIVSGLTLYQSEVNARPNAQNYSGVDTYLDPFASGVTHTTTTINTTSTQAIASTTKLSGIINTGNYQVTCVMDDRGTTAASSTVAAGRGIILGPAYQTTSSIPSEATFGECYPGATRCYPHKGAVNCLAGTASVVTIWSK